MAALCLFLPGFYRAAGLLPALLMVLMPASTCHMFSNYVKRNSQWTKPQRLRFGPFRLTRIGQDWQQERKWESYVMIAEDPMYFYLYLFRDTIDPPDVFPKSAFTPEQQQQFYEYARTSPNRLVVGPEPATRAQESPVGADSGKQKGMNRSKEERKSIFLEWLRIHNEALLDAFSRGASKERALDEALNVAGARILHIYGLSVNEFNSIWKEGMRKWHPLRKRWWEFWK